MKRTVVCGVLVLLGAILEASPASAMPTMASYDNGTVALKIPKGWHVVVNAKAGTVVVQRNPASATSPTIVVVRAPYQKGLTARSLMQRALGSLGVKARVISQRFEQGGKGMQVLAQATHNNMVIRIGAMTLVAPATGQAVFGAVMSLATEYDKLGGHKLLHAVAFSIRPSKAATGTARPAARVRFPRKNIVGQWQDVGVSGLADRVDGYGRVVGHDMRGAGMSIQLSKNGRFKIHYYAKMVSGVCRSEARMVEIGRYSYNGRYLTLTSQGHKGDICTCCRGNKRTKVNKRYRKRRKYEVFGVSGKPHAMVLRGTCAPYMVDTRCRSTNSVIKGGPPDIVGNFKFGRVVKK